MSVCPICLRESTSGPHSACLTDLFDRPVALALDMTSPEAISLTVELADKLSISGAQPKFSMRLDPESGALRPVARGGTHILKPMPKPPPFPHLAANEHVTMRLAEAVGIEVPPCAVVRLTDGEWAYIVRRFDRVAGERLHMEDFCVGLGWHPDRKEHGHAQDCAALIERVSVEPELDLSQFYRRMVFFWWACCGDMHLRNFSMLSYEESQPPRSGRRGRLSPAYDMACTWFYASNQQKHKSSHRMLSIKIFGRDRSLTPKLWRLFADRCHLSPVARTRILDEVIGRYDEVQALIEACHLPDEYKEQYLSVLAERARDFPL